MARAKPQSTGRAASPTVRELQALRSMIETRKLAAAAALLDLTQSAVSRALSSLERKVGSELFRHEAGRLAPTSQAFALNAAAECVFEGLRLVEQWPDVAVAAQSLQIATSPTFAQYLIPALLREFYHTDADTTISVEILTGTQVVSAVAERKVDLGIVDASAVHPGVRCEIFRESSVHAIMPAGHRLAGVKTLTPKDLADEPLLVQTRRFAARAEIDRAFARAGVAPRIACEAVTSGFALELMRKGLGIALVSPYPIILDLGRGFAVRRFVPAIRQRTALILPATGSMSVAAGRFCNLVHVQPPADGYSKPHLRSPGFPRPHERVS